MIALVELVRERDDLTARMGAILASLPDAGAAEAMDSDDLAAVVDEVRALAARSRGPG